MITHFVAVLTKPRMSKKTWKYFFPNRGEWPLLLCLRKSWTS